MKIDFRQNLSELKSYLEENVVKHEFIPIVIVYIDAMIKLLEEKDNNLRDIAEIAYGIERVISEDLDFCESRIGERIFAVLNSIIDASRNASNNNN
jgi:hypothetical protein